MLSIDGMTFKYPQSTALALACAANAIARNAWTKEVHDRFAAACDAHLRAVDGGDLIHEPTSLPVQIDALALLRADAAARREAREAVAALYADTPEEGWIVKAFGPGSWALTPELAPVRLA